MNNRYEINTISDILNFSPEQIIGIIPDLAEYLIICAELIEKGHNAKDIPKMVWIDDGEVGLKEVEIV